MNNEYTDDKALDDIEDLGYEDDEEEDFDDEDIESFVDCMKRHSTDIHKLRA